jgi:hypothetical protein
VISTRVGAISDATVLAGELAEHAGLPEPVVCDRREAVGDA